MGFGSYDESEQREQDFGSEEDDEAVVNVHKNEFEGKMSVDTTATTEDLIRGLDAIKRNEE